MYSYDKMNVTIEFYPETYPKTTYHMAVMQTCIVGQNNITFFYLNLTPT